MADSLRLVMTIVKNAGNYLNSGSNRGGAEGVLLSSCVKTNLIRSGDPRCKTLLHFVARVANGRLLNSGTLANDLISVSEAARAPLSNTATLISSVRAGLTAVKRELEARCRDEGQQNVVAAKMVSDLLEGSASTAATWLAKDVFDYLDVEKKQSIKITQLLRWNNHHGGRIENEVTAFKGFPAVNGVVSADSFITAFGSSELRADVHQILSVGAVLGMSPGNSSGGVMSSSRRCIQRLNGWFDAATESVDVRDTVVLMRTLSDCMTQDLHAVEADVKGLLTEFGENAEELKGDEATEWFKQLGNFVKIFEAAFLENDRYDELQLKKQRIEAAKKQREAEMRQRKEARKKVGGLQVGYEATPATAAQKRRERQAKRGAARPGGGGVLDTLMKSVKAGDYGSGRRGSQTARRGSVNFSPTGNRGSISFSPLERRGSLVSPSGRRGSTTLSPRERRGSINAAKQDSLEARLRRVKSTRGLGINATRDGENQSSDSGSGSSEDEDSDDDDGDDGL